MLEILNIDLKNKKKKEKDFRQESKGDQAKVVEHRRHNRRACRSYRQTFSSESTD